MIPQQYRLFLVLTLICFQSISAQKVTIVNIDGNNSVEEEVYKNSILQNLSKSLDEIKFEIEKQLTSRGFYNSKIENLSIDTTSTMDSIVVSLKFIEGEQTRIRNIVVDSLESSDSISVQSQFMFLHGEVFIEDEIERKIEKLIIDFENSGHPFVKVTISSVYFSDDKDGNNIVDIFLKLEKDKLRNIDKVEIRGNKKTNDNVIINNARLTKGEAYSQEKLEQIPVLLKKLNFFKSVAKPSYYINSDDEGILQLEIEEKNTNSFDGILGYIPSTSDGESGYLTGFVNIGLRNLFGTGRGALIKWRQENSLTQELELKYLEPWIFNQPFNIHFQFFQRKQDSSYVKRIIGGNLEFLATENFSASFIVESESIIPSLNVSNNIFPNSSSINTGIEVMLDYRDDLYSPKSGSYFYSRYKYRSKTIDNLENINNVSSVDVNFNYYELDFGVFHQLFQSQVIALGIHAKAIVGDKFDITDLFQFGGTNSLRGFRENQFIGNKIIWSNLEYRFLLSESSYLFSFYDAGYYLIDENSSQNIIKQSDFKNGYGLGISLETALGIMRVSYAFAEGGSISNGLIHFGILNDF